MSGKCVTTSTARASFTKPYGQRAAGVSQTGDMTW
jgi:hypothetical protein